MTKYRMIVINHLGAFKTSFAELSVEEVKEMHEFCVKLASGTLSYLNITDDKELTYYFNEEILKQSIIAVEELEG